MGKAEEILSGAAGWNAGTAAERFPEDAERNLLDRAERGVVARSAGAIRAMADGVQTVRRVAEKRTDRENLP